MTDKKTGALCEVHPFFLSVLVFCHFCKFLCICSINFFVGRMQVITVRINAGLVITVLFIVFFDQEPAALRTVLIFKRLEVRNKVTLRIVRAAVEFFSSATSFSCYNLTVTAFFRAFCERN